MEVSGLGDIVLSIYSVSSMLSHWRRMPGDEGVG